MATLNEKELRRRKKKNRKIYLAAFFTLAAASPLLAELLEQTLTGLFTDFGNFRYDFRYIRCIRLLFTRGSRATVLVIFLFLCACFCMLEANVLKAEISDTETREVARGIHTPVPVGNGQYGTARFMTERELKEEFSEAVYDGKGKLKNLPPDAGIIVDYRKQGKKEVIKYLSEPVNADIIGATRSGKTRRLLLTSTWLNLLAGVNLLIVDVKGEIYAYTNEFAKAHGYEVRTLDFRYPEKSMHFNNLSEIVTLLREGMVSEAVDKAWDIVSILVGEPKGERIWTDGQCATIAAAILIVAQDAPERCKNLTNVYYFLAYMCESDLETGDMPVNDYMEQLPENHPARGAFQIAKIAPFRTRSSFFTSALATLRLFTAWNVADVTGASDYGFSDTDEKRVVTYLIFPDERTTYHPIGAIYMKQYYESLVNQAAKKGGRLDRRFIFRADEIGNFPVIPGLGTMLSAGAGRNIFFELVLQDYQQLEGKYKEDFRNIRTNCQLTVCLKATDEQTTKNISTRLGNYTIQVNSASSSQSDSRKNGASYSNSSNMAGRPLLYPDEISNITKPDALILYGGKKAVTNLPDISAYYANQEFGMGSEEENRQLFLDRMEKRPAREIAEPALWGVWKDWGTAAKEPEDDERVTFL